jgi:Ca2+-binding RTX toxin-like protein
LRRSRTLSFIMVTAATLTALVAPAATAATPASTCLDPVTGVPFSVRWTGTESNDIYWTGPSDVVNALEGDDWIFSEASLARAVACLGPGADTFAHSNPVEYSPGRYGVLGGPGNDHITGGAGNDVLHGEGDNDTLIGGPGHDVVDGGDGIDRCHAEVMYNCEFPF